MNLSEALRYVRGGVANKDFIPVLTHFYINDGRIQGSDGRISIDSACDQLRGFSGTVSANSFLRAVDACGEEAEVTLTDAGKLRVKKGAFKVLIPMLDPAEYPHSDMRGEFDSPPQDMLERLKKAVVFVGTDISRPWSCGVNLTEGYLYSTNNITLTRSPVDYTGNSVNIPAYAIQELIRINRDICGIRVADNHIVFDLGESIYLRAQLLAYEWPDVSNMFISCDIPLISGLPEAIALIAPFCSSNRVIFAENGVSTPDDEVHSATFEGLCLTESQFDLKQIQSILPYCTHLDLTGYPDKCSFKGEGIEGVFVGIRP